MAKWTYYLLSLFGLWLLSGLFTSPTVSATSQYDNVVEYVDQFTFMGTEVKSIDDFTTLLREKSTCSSSVIALLDYDAKYMSESAANALFIRYIPDFKMVVFANSTGSIGLNWNTSGTPALQRVAITNSGNNVGRYYTVTDSGSCTTVTGGLNYSTPLLVQGDKLFFTRGNVFSEPKATYPAGYEGTKFKQSEYIPPSPEPSGDGITKEEMAELLTPFANIIGAIAGIGVIWLAYTILLKGTLKRIG